jgi:hypothetical protein
MAKPEYNDHPRDPKIVVVVDRWSLFRSNSAFKMEPQYSVRHKHEGVIKFEEVYPISLKGLQTQNAKSDKNAFEVLNQEIQRFLI